MSPIPDEPRGQIGYGFGAGTLTVTDVDGDEWDFELLDHAHVLVVSYEHTTVVEILDPADNDRLVSATFDVVALTFKPAESFEERATRTLEELFGEWFKPTPVPPPFAQVDTVGVATIL